jgi:hypothetical protein
MNKFLSSTHFLHQQLHSIEDKENTICRIGEQKNQLFLCFNPKPVKGGLFWIFSLLCTLFNTASSAAPQILPVSEDSDSQKL